MVDAATDIRDQIRETVQASEQYAHSLSTIRRLGRFAVHQDSEFEQRQAIEDLAFADFSTAVSEMLKTDPEFREALDINNSREHVIVDGQVRAVDGRAMVDILETGVTTSKEAMKHDPSLAGQHVRDLCDVEVAKRADALKPGETLWAVSLDPKTDMRRYPKTYKELGYKEGLAYIQTYSKTNRGTLVAGSYSVDNSNATALREVLSSRGMIIPQDATENEWLKHGATMLASPEQAEAFVIGVREQHYKAAGKTADRLSINEYVHRNEPLVRRFFDEYYPAFSRAAYTGQNNETLQSLAIAVLDKKLDLHPHIRQQLIKVGNSKYFDDEQGKIIDSIVRYAVTEELRKGLIHPLKPSPKVFAMETYIGQVLDINTMLAHNIQTGIAAKRSYGGCPGNIELANSQNDLLNQTDQSNPQEAYAGAGKESILKCVTCPLCKRQGVDAHITYDDTKGTKTIQCNKCRQSKTYQA